MMYEMWRTTVYCDVNCTFIYFCLHCSYNSFRRQFCCQSINWQWSKQSFDLSLFLGEKVSNFVDLKRSRSTFNYGYVRIGGSFFNILCISQNSRIFGSTKCILKTLNDFCCQIYIFNALFGAFLIIIIFFLHFMDIVESIN